MPLYTFVCQKCKKELEILVRGNEQPKCPRCNSTKLTRQAGVFAAVTGSESSRNTGPSGPCCSCSKGNSCPLGGE